MHLLNVCLSFPLRVLYKKYNQLVARFDLCVFMKTKKINAIFMWGLVYFCFSPLENCIAAHPNKITTGWFFQCGMDMSLQRPYGFDFSDVFPNGKTYGVDIALGRKFTPMLGLRAKANWENGIHLLENKYATWLAPFFERGVNMERGGYLSVIGDVELNLHGLFCDNVNEQLWNVYIYPRGGLVYNFGVDKGSPLIGMGFGNSFRFNDRYILYLDMAYNAVSSGFVGVIKETGTGTNHNGFFDINLGVQVELGSTNTKCYRSEDYNSFWSGWFVQAGLDMTLYKPYKFSISEVFPKGKTIGVDLALGKWFSTEIAVRGRFNWENGIRLFENDLLEWVASSGDGSTNMDKGGCLAIYMDVPLSVSNLFFLNVKDRDWNFYVFPRVGLASNLAVESASPIIGGGIGCTYSICNTLSLYYDMSFQGITSEFFGKIAVTGMDVGTKFNSFMDFHIGIQWNL